MTQPVVSRFASAADFLDALRPSRWVPGGSWGPSAWIFRGEGDASRELIPSAWRSKWQEQPGWAAIASKVLDEWIEHKFKNHQNCPGGIERVASLYRQMHVEVQAVRFFERFMDRLGYRVPQSTLRFPDDGITHEPGDVGSSQPHHPLLGLAQHHGLGTRLLDWTESPVIAAFFAVANPDQQGDPTVYALNISHLGDYGVFRVPRCEIGYLHAQHGLFTYFKRPNTYFLEHGRWPRLNEAAVGGHLKKYVLPSSEANELRRLCWLEGVSMAHLMPSLDTIQVSLRHQWASVEPAFLALPQY